MFVVVAFVVVLAVDPRILPLQFGQIWVSNSWYIVVAVVCDVVINVNSRNLPLDVVVVVFSDADKS